MNNRRPGIVLDETVLRVRDDRDQNNRWDRHDNRLSNNVQMWAAIHSFRPMFKQETQSHYDVSVKGAQK